MYGFYTTIKQSGREKNYTYVYLKDVLSIGKNHYQ